MRKMMMLILAFGVLLVCSGDSGAGMTPDAVYCELFQNGSATTSSDFTGAIFSYPMEMDWEVSATSATLYFQGELGSEEYFVFWIHWSDTGEAMPLSVETTDVFINSIMASYEIIPSYKEPGQEWYLDWQQTDLHDDTTFWGQFPTSDEARFQFNIPEGFFGFYHINITMTWGPSVANGADTWGQVKSLFQ